MSESEEGHNIIGLLFLENGGENERTRFGSRIVLCDRFFLMNRSNRKQTESVQVKLRPSKQQNLTNAGF